MRRFFHAAERSLSLSVFREAERLVENFYRLKTGAVREHRYDVKTLVDLKEHEMSDRAFAHLCRYRYHKENREDHPGNFSFFSICLQDDRIIDAIERSRPFVRLIPLVFYIATHELVHIVRFATGESDFEAPQDERIREEEQVDVITRKILRPVADSNLGIVLDCFDDRYHIGDVFTHGDYSALT